MFDNTTTEKVFNKSNEFIAYRITPVEGYVLHINTLDEPVLDELGFPTGAMKPAYTNTFIQIHKNYNFKDNLLEIYAVKESEI